MGIKNIIIASAKNNESKDKLKDRICDSHSQTYRVCKKIFSCNYRKLKNIIKVANILIDCIGGVSGKELANKYFNGDLSKLYKKVKEFSDGYTLRQIREIYNKGGRCIMVDSKIMKAKVISTLADADGNVTLKQLGVPRSIIVELREDGFQIISVPGRYNSGYNLKKTSKIACENWINNIRRSMGLSTDYTLPA